MRTRRQTALVALLVGCAACGGGGGGPRRVDVASLGFAFSAPTGTRDVVLAAGEGPEAVPAVYLSTRSLARRGGPACAAGAVGAVSPFPLGRVLVLSLPPDAGEVRTLLAPEEAPGEPLAHLDGDRWLYFTPPPDEPCAGPAADLQDRQTAVLREALRGARPLP